jgi:hypothetical protein
MEFPLNDRFHVPFLMAAWLVDVSMKVLAGVEKQFLVFHSHFVCDDVARGVT